eukprot:TRINITY_DN17283_c0_g2_i1.p1 TRINITY_DN17283_c0_g2~~TRINITY_DN17283_c0_g2_i1.p1  ORF type:complete len:283 (-),score=54.14 TRINITY_DN17283_c0_g2_i1:5-853(-)
MGPRSFLVGPTAEGERRSAAEAANETPTSAPVALMGDVSSDVAVHSRGRRVVEAVRRGAVRSRPAGCRVTAPSAWEHVEVELPTDNSSVGIERVASLSLSTGGAFDASIGVRRSDDETSPAALSRASGEWRECRGGVQLTFLAEPAIGLEEFNVVYMLRRNCLVANEAQLPDGLAQEYSSCSCSVASGDKALDCNGSTSIASTHRGMETEDAEVTQRGGFDRGGDGCDIWKSSVKAFSSGDEGEARPALQPVGIIMEGESGSCSSGATEEYADDFEGDDDDD